VTVVADGVLSYDPGGAFDALAEGENGEDGFSYTLAGGTSAAVSITLTGTNDAPAISVTAEPLSYTEDAEPLLLSPTALVTDPDTGDWGGGSLTVAFAGGSATRDDLLSLAGGGELGVEDGAIFWEGALIGSVSGGSEGAPLIVSFIAGANVGAVQAVLRAVAYSSLSQNSDGAARTLIFTLADGDGGSSTAQAALSIAPVDDAPAAQDDEAEAGEDGETAVDAAANDDIDGPAPAIVSVADSALDPDGWVALESGARVRLSAEGKLLYDPNRAFDALADGEMGADSFTYTLANGSSANVTLWIRGTDDAPVAVDDMAATDEASGVRIDVLANDTDVDGGPRPVTAIAGKAVGAGETVTLASGARVTLGADGALTYDPAGAFAALVDPVTGAANSSAQDSFTYTLSGGSTAAVTVTLSGITGAGDTLDGSAQDDVLLGTATADTLRLEGGGEDRASGGGGDDIFFLGTALSDGDRFDGGPGKDTLLLQGDQSGRLRAGHLTGIESLGFVSARGLAPGGDSAFQYILASDDGALAAGATLLVDATRLAADEASISTAVPKRTPPSSFAAEPAATC
jgi:VCBS repeat-containing protein